MQLSGWQWFFLVVLDVLSKAGCLLFIVLFISYPFPVFLSLSLSALHLGVLFLAICLTTWLGQATRASMAVAVLVTNVIFVGVVISADVVFETSAGGTSCHGSTLECSWIDGVITWYGVLWLVYFAIFLVVVNVIPVLIVSAFGLTGNRTAP
jgi:hypothetical protein